MQLKWMDDCSKFFPPAENNPVAVEPDFSMVVWKGSPSAEVLSKVWSQLILLNEETPRISETYAV